VCNVSASRSIRTGARVAADVLQYLPPVDAGTSPETLRNHRLQFGKRLRDAAAAGRRRGNLISLDSTFIRSRTMANAT
jgi:hypothetical protein